ncbi:MAG: hypothetical protein KC561_13050, partial [Myxococcales bacterium]|nr:hypothetical protein [Myxococcales bacterium]
MASNKAGRDFFIDLGKNGVTSAVYLLTGEESLLVDEAIRALTKAVLPTGGDEFSHQVFLGAEAKGASVRQSLETLSLFGGERLIHVRDIANMPSDELDALAGYEDNPAPETVLLLSGTAVDKR